MCDKARVRDGREQVCVIEKQRENGNKKERKLGSVTGKRVTAL